MALNWDISHIEDYENLCWVAVTDPDEAKSIKEEGATGLFGAPCREEPDGTISVLNAVTHSLIWMMMALGVNGKITASNVEEVAKQVMIYQRVNGAALSVTQDGKKRDRYITPDDVRSHIGLKTNAFGKSNSKRGFKESIWRALQENALDWIEQQQRRASEDL